MPNTGPGSYRCAEHRRYLDVLLEELGVRERVTLVVHGWGSALGFDWASRHREAVYGIAYMEAIVQRRGWNDPGGLCLDPLGALVYLNSGDDRILALDLHGYVVRDSGRIPGLDPGGAEFGPDGRYCVTARRERTIRALPPTLDGEGEILLPKDIVPFPRGFGFGHDGRLYLASGAPPSGPDDNTIAVFDRSGTLCTPRLVTDPKLSPLDLKLPPNGNIVVASEWPFGAQDAVSSVREYDPITGQLVRVLVPDRSVGFTRPRGLRFGPGGRLYCAGQDHVVAFDFRTGRFVGPLCNSPASTDRR